MKKVWRKLYRRELLCNFIMYGLLVFMGGCLLLYQVIRIAAGQVVFAEALSLLGISIVIILALNLLAVVSLYKLSKSNIKWHKKVLDSISIPVIVTDKDARLQQVNKAARNIMNLKQDSDIEGLNSKHLIDKDGCVMKKIWIHNGTEYRTTGNRLHCDGKDSGYLILLNNTYKTPDSCETRTGLINEINRLLGRLSTATDQFRDCASILTKHNTQQAKYITELSDIIVGIASGELNEPEALNEKMYTVKADMQRYVESNQEHLQTIKRTVEALDVARDSIDSVIHNIDDA